MLLGFHPHPGGIFDRSPTFQRWVPQSQSVQVPKGRLMPCDTSVVPSGLGRDRIVPPNVETLGYSRWSLRDEGPLSPQRIPRVQILVALDWKSALRARTIGLTETTST